MNNVIVKVANFCNLVSTTSEKKRSDKELESEIKLLKEAKTKKNYNVEFVEKEFHKATQETV